jgi:uncharacterized protein (TIGR00251 family)
VDNTDFRIRESGADIEVPLHVQTRARRTQIAGLYDRTLKVKISAPPVDDAANRAIVEFFSALLGHPKSRFHIISGEKSRTKVLRIEGMSLKRFEEMIAPHL